MIGGLGEYAIRSTVNVLMVASTSAIGAASMSSWWALVNDTRAGGRCRAPDSRSRLPSKPNFQSFERWATAVDARPGSGRFGGSSSSSPRQARNVA